jgi:hypothetical protein
MQAHTSCIWKAYAVQNSGKGDAEQMDNEGMAGAWSERELGSIPDDELMRQVKLRALGCTQKSMTARLGAVIELIEALLARGYDRSQARDILIETGWRFTPDSFDSALSRVRRRRLRADAEACRSDRSIDARATEDRHGKAPDEQPVVSAQARIAGTGCGAAQQSNNDARRSMADVLANRGMLLDPLRWR